MKIISFKTFINEMIIPPIAVHDVNANKRFYPELLKGLRKRKLDNLIKKKLGKIKRSKKIEESIKKTKNSFGILQGSNVKKAKPNKGVSPPIKTELDYYNKDKGLLNVLKDKIKNKIKKTFARPIVTYKMASQEKEPYKTIDKMNNDPKYSEKKYNDIEKRIKQYKAKLK